MRGSDRWETGDLVRVRVGLHPISVPLRDVQPGRDGSTARPAVHGPGRTGS